MSALKRVFGWVRRAFVGEELKVGEKIESPKRLIAKAFLKRKSTLVALALLVGIFLFVFIAPLFFPIDLNASDPLQQNVAPCFSLRKLPKKLQVGMLLLIQQ